MTDFQSGFIAVIGRPNVGQKLTGQRTGRREGGPSFPISPRPRETGSWALSTGRIIRRSSWIRRAYKNRATGWGRSWKERYPVRWRMSKRVDGCHGWLQSGLWRAGMKAAFARAAACRVPVLTVINKTDIMPFQKRQSLRETIAEKVQSQAVFLLSAKTGEGLYELLCAIVALLPPGPAYFPKDEITDKPESFLCAEIVRGKSAAAFNGRGAARHRGSSSKNSWSATTESWKSMPLFTAKNPAIRGSSSVKTGRCSSGSVRWHARTWKNWFDAKVFPIALRKSAGRLAKQPIGAERTWI